MRVYWRYTRERYGARGATEMATYVALSTINAQMSGWQVLARGTDKAAVEQAADAAIAAEHVDPTNIYRDTLSKNLRVVSLTNARRIAGRCALGECDHDHGVDE